MKKTTAVLPGWKRCYWVSPLTKKGGAKLGVANTSGDRPITRCRLPKRVIRKTTPSSSLPKKELQAIKRGLLRSNTRNVYKGDDDDQWVEHLLPVQEIATEIERRRVEMGKTSGFERLYAKVTKLYFGGMARHLAGLRPFLRPGARLAYVVGDQASFLRVKIPTGEILAQIATRLGFTFVRLVLRLADFGGCLS